MARISRMNIGFVSKILNKAKGIKKPTSPARGGLIGDLAESLLLAHSHYHISKFKTFCQAQIVYFPKISFIFALVRSPTKPVPFSKPIGAKISLTYFS